MPWDGFAFLSEICVRGYPFPGSASRCDGISERFFSYNTKISQIRQKNLNRSKNQWDGCVFLAILFTHCCRLSLFSRHAKSSLVRVIVKLA